MCKRQQQRQQHQAADQNVQRNYPIVAAHKVRNHLLLLRRRLSQRGQA
ncbi:hypothetical protein D918_04916 [Trichuris suis]|nr:hypothetical protein D918_04916 [Trichuris suis]